MRRIVCVFIAAGFSACATTSHLPAPDIIAAARVASTYSAELQIGLRGPELYGRARTILGFRRPDRLRIELPSPQGARLVLVVKDGVATAVFPVERAYFEGPATVRTMGIVTGVALSVQDVMDLLTGGAPPGVSAHRVSWGPLVPSRVRGTLEDGTSLDIKVKEPQLGRDITEAAFLPPPHEGYRSVTAEEARDLWVVRR